MKILGLLLLPMLEICAEMNDVDMADTGSDTSSTRELDANLDNQDPNLHNPQFRHGYGDGDSNPKQKWVDTTTAKPRNIVTKTTPVPDSFSQQTYMAALELGIIVSYKKRKPSSFQEFKSCVHASGSCLIKV